MKRNINIVALASLMFLISCGQLNNTKAILEKSTVTATDLQSDEEGKLKKKEQIEENEKNYSIYLDNILKDAIAFFLKDKSNYSFRKNYQVMMPDSSYNVEVDINSKNYFTSDFPHVIIRRNTPSAIYFDIFSNINNKLDKVVSHEQWALTYENDTIYDINGDGLKDFVVNWYGASGCCLKAFSNVYLLRADKKSFSSSFEFINPTFSPKEKVIRGVSYGHPGETEMYKYRWNGEKVDTLEYIYYERNEKSEKTGKVIVSKHEPSINDEQILKRLNSVPKEYRSIQGYDWFTGKGYE